MAEFIVDEDFHPDVRGYRELVRCEDCIYGEIDEDVVICQKDGRNHDLDWFCGDGEKLVGVNTINLPDDVKIKVNKNIKKIKEIDMKVIGNIDSWLTDICEQPSRFSSELYSDSDQSMYAEQTLEILDIIKELMRQ